MGLGDALLVMLAGAWFGWSGALITLGAGAVQGTLAVVPMMLFGKKVVDPEEVKRDREEFQRELAMLTEEERAEALAEYGDDPLLEEHDGRFGTTRIAFGPFLILTILELLLLGRETIFAWFEWAVTP
jgi:leader peptidase (prepilin peptidase)/N-methyltransferase